MKWVTRERPKIDRLACPWLIQRFIDKDAQILFVPTAKVLPTARQEDAVPFDVPGVELTHDGPRCSFDAILKKYKLDDPALARLAVIVRAADTDTLKLSSQAPGLLAISLGLGVNFRDDQELLRASLVIYDALYAWCQLRTDERHGWHPETVQKEMDT